MLARRPARIVLWTLSVDGHSVLAAAGAVTRRRLEYGRVTLKRDPCGVQGCDITEVDSPGVPALEGRTL